MALAETGRIGHRGTLLTQGLQVQTLEPWTQRKTSGINPREGLCSGRNRMARAETGRMGHRGTLLRQGLRVQTLEPGTQRKAEGVHTSETMRAGQDRAECAGARALRLAARCGLFITFSNLNFIE